MPKQWSLPIGWAWKIVSWKQQSISDKLFLMLSRIARSYLGLRQQMIWTILQLPPELTRFLEYVISGSNTADCSEHVKRIILSIDQDICRGVSNGKWKMLKHVLLASTIRHLYRGKKLMIIINWLGHCDSYNYICELEHGFWRCLVVNISDR